MAMIIGFVSGTIPVIWPWKKIIFLTDNNGNPLVNEIGKNEIKNYLYFLPEFNSFSNLYSLLFILIGFIIIQILEYHGRKKLKFTVLLVEILIIHFLKIILMKNLKEIK